MQPMPYFEAFEAVKDAFRLIWPEADGWKITIYPWNKRASDDDHAGFRIAEISGWKPDKTGPGGYGETFGQSEPANAAVLFAAERYLLDLMYYPEDAEETLERLQATIK